MLRDDTAMTQRRRPKVSSFVAMVGAVSGVDRGEVFATCVVADQAGSRTGTREVPLSRRRFAFSVCEAER